MAAMSTTPAESIVAGDVLALSRAITWIEEGRPEGRAVLEDLAARVGRAVRVGVTGPPGVGKSTLIDALTQEWKARGLSTGILAVDPTSPFTGGALLGDRIRMARASEAGARFIRSMATRGASGGLSRAAADACDLIDASGVDRILVETVGAGQAEVDVARATDLVLLLLSPETGDGVQAMKSGLMEIADIVVLNKADRPGADRLEIEVRQALDLSTRGRAGVPVIPAEALRGRGVPELAAAIEKEIAARRTSGAFDARRRENLVDRIRQAAETLALARLWGGGDGRLAALASEVAAGRRSSHSAAEEIVARALEKAP